MKKLSLIVAAAALALPGAAFAAPCKDAKGKFIKCTTAAAPAAKASAAPAAKAAKAPAKAKGAVKRCRDAKGRFAKCPK